MENNTQIIGNESSIFCFNLNKQFSNVKKVIITKEILLNSFENEQIKDLIDTLKKTSKDNYKETIRKNSDVFETNIKSELYQQIQESLNHLSNNYVDVQLKNYNFMNAVSNSKFNLTLRCESFSITKYYIEKGTILTNIRNIIKQYLNFEGNIYRNSAIDSFQIEIYETDEIYKHIYLKKEGNSLILSASYGFPKNSPIDHTTGQEFYISKGKEFQYFQNNQTTAMLREHSKLVEKEIKKQDKILSNDDLVLVNEKTKNIEDALIECYISSKGQIKILNLSLIENSIDNYSENGFIINKSSNNYNTITTITPSDNIEEETINPKYLLLKNETDIKEFFSDIKITESVDGIITTKNFYIPYLETLGQKKNIDIIYFNKNLSKKLQEKINWENLDIENTQTNTQEQNPFKGIISEKNKEKDEMLEKLKNIDLYSNQQATQKNNNNYAKEYIQNAVNTITGSKQSSFNQKKEANTMNNSNEKKSAIGMLMDSAMEQKNKIEEEKKTSAQQQYPQQPQNNQQPQEQQNNYNEQHFSNPNYQQQTYNQNNNTQNMPNQNQFSNQMQNQMQNEIHQKKLNDFTNNYNNQNNSNPQFENNYNNNQNQFQTYTNQETTQQIPQTQQHNTASQTTYETQNNQHLSRYDNIWTIEIIGDPNLDVDAYFVDQNTISQVGNKKTYYLTLNPQEMQNPNLQYVLPIGLNNNQIKGCHLLINTPLDYFQINKDQQGVSYFVNISEMNNQIKKNFVDEIVNKVGEISLVCLKSDLDLIENDINKIKCIQIVDAKNNEELKEVKNKILQLEKKFLIKNK